MPKPMGLDFTISDRGMSLHSVRPSHAEDAIWDAVETAINNGWTPEQFKIEAASAWKDRQKQDGEHAEKVLSK